MSFDTLHVNCSCFSLIVICFIDPLLRQYNFFSRARDEKSFKTFVQLLYVKTTRIDIVKSLPTNRYDFPIITIIVRKIIKQERLNCCKPASIHERSKLLIRLSLYTKIYIKHTKVDNCMSDKLHGISNKKCQKPCKTQK